MSQDPSRPRSTSEAAPDPEDPRKPDSPADLARPSWKYVARKTLREFLADECTDQAAALTYYAVLAIAPALLAVVSVLGLVGDPEQTLNRVMDLVADLGAPDQAAETVQPIVEAATSNTKAGLALILGVLLALWSASGYVAAFGRGMNRIYEVEEGRPIWKLRPVILLITLVLVVIAVLVVVAMVLSGPVARAIGDTIGLSDTAVTVWNVLKWPVVVALVVVAIAILFHGTPNVRQPKFRWISVGATVALLVWVVASVAFGFYVTTFASYDATYGSLAGVVVFLLWLWISNLALLFGAELDAELERGRQLQGGIEAEETLQLPARDTTASDKKAAKAEEDVRRGRELRLRAQRSSDGDRSGDRQGDRTRR